jgi:hypothetical protein
MQASTVEHAQRDDDKFTVAGQHDDRQREVHPAAFAYRGGRAVPYGISGLSV